MNMRVRVGLLLLVTAAFVAAFLDYSASWSERGWLASHARRDATEVLQQVQLTQRDCHARLSRACRDVPELLRVDAELHGAPSSEPLRKLAAQPAADPGFAKEGSFTGSAYFISIVRADEHGFLARARYVGFRKHGEDVWEISAEGPARHATISAALVPNDRGANAAIALLLLMIGLLVSVFSRRRGAEKSRDGS